MNFVLKILIITIFILIVLHILATGIKALDFEPFSVSIIDPYSLKLHQEISEKQRLWNKMHRNVYYYHWYYVQPKYM